MRPGKHGWETLVALKQDPGTAAIPVVIVSGVDRRNKGFALGAAEYLVKPVERETVLRAIQKHLPETQNKQAILIVDDEPRTLEVLSEFLADSGYSPVPACGGPAGLDLLSQMRPDGILLDLVMPENDGFEIIQTIKKDARLQGVPIFILTGKALTSGESELLAQQTHTVFRKTDLWKQDLLGEVRKATGWNGTQAPGSKRLPTNPLR
ncbi:MAG: PleD family two-component system response regulator [Candidatus Korobacteraceae bacterium]